MSSHMWTGFDWCEEIRHLEKQTLPSIAMYFVCVKNRAAINTTFGIRMFEKNTKLFANTKFILNFATDYYRLP